MTFLSSGFIHLHYNHSSSSKECVYTWCFHLRVTPSLKTKRSVAPKAPRAVALLVAFLAVSPGAVGIYSGVIVLAGQSTSRRGQENTTPRCFFVDGETWADNLNIFHVFLLCLICLFYDSIFWELHVTCSFEDNQCQAPIWPVLSRCQLWRCSSDPLLNVGRCGGFVATADGWQKGRRCDRDHR